VSRTLIRVPSLTEKQVRLIEKSWVILIFACGPVWIAGAIAYIFRHETAANVLGIAAMLVMVGIVAPFIRALDQTGPPFDTLRGFWPWWPLRR
jgi:hypothetical protein